MSNRPAFFDPATEPETAFWGQWSITVHREPPGLCGVCKLHTRPGGLIYRWTVSARSMVTTARSLEIGAPDDEGEIATTQLLGKQRSQIDEIWHRDDG
jgi:hypothetical protein